MPDLPRNDQAVTIIWGCLTIFKAKEVFVKLPDDPHSTRKALALELCACERPYRLKVQWNTISNVLHKLSF
jgi:hypothetical protein